MEVHVGRDDPAHPPVLVGAHSDVHSHRHYESYPLQTRSEQAITSRLSQELPEVYVPVYLVDLDAVVQLGLDQLERGAA